MSGDIPIRVTVLDTLEEIDLKVPTSTTVADVKQAALTQSRVRGPASEFVVKWKGAELYEGDRTLADAGVLPNGALIVLRRRRIPAR
jgi:hypothetical protein